MPEIWFPNLGIKIASLNRVAVTLFGIEIYWYGVIMCISILAGMLLLSKELKRTGQDEDFYMDFLIWTILACVIGARLYYVAFSWDSYKDNLLEIFNLRNGGLAIYGSVAAGVLMAVFYTKKNKKDFWEFTDTLAPSLLLGQVIGRWGNFFNREAFGGYTDSIFAMRYLKSQVSQSNISNSIAENIVKISGTEYIQVHPTFLYESLWNFAVLLILLYVKKKKRFNGEICCLYFIGYSAGRIWIESLRTDQLLLWNTNIAVSELLSGLLLAFAILIYLKKLRKYKTGRLDDAERY